MFSLLGYHCSRTLWVEGCSKYVYVCTCSYVRINMHLHVFVFLCRYLWEYICETKFTMIPPVPVQHHRVHSRVLLFHICNSLLQQWKTWVPVSSICVFIETVPPHVNDLISPQHPFVSHLHGSYPTSEALEVQLKKLIGTSTKRSLCSSVHWDILS